MIIYNVVREEATSYKDGGSIFGGEIVTIRATGHDTDDWYNNKIFFGKYSCTASGSI